MDLPWPDNNVPKPGHKWDFLKMLAIAGIFANIYLAWVLNKEIDKKEEKRKKIKRENKLKKIWDKEQESLEK